MWVKRGWETPRRPPRSGGRRSSPRKRSPLVDGLAASPRRWTPGNRHGRSNRPSPPFPARAGKPLQASLRAAARHQAPRSRGEAKTAQSRRRAILRAEGGRPDKARLDAQPRPGTNSRHQRLTADRPARHLAVRRAHQPGSHVHCNKSKAPLPANGYDLCGIRASQKRRPAGNRRGDTGWRPTG